MNIDNATVLALLLDDLSMYLCGGQCGLPAVWKELTKWQSNVDTEQLLYYVGILIGGGNIRLPIGADDRLAQKYISTQKN